LPTFDSQHCDEAIVIPSPEKDLPAYRDALLSIAARPDVDTVFPVREEDVYLLSKYRAQFEEHVSFVVPPFERLRIAHDRMRLVEAAEKADVPTPRTRLLDDVPDWSPELLVKSRYNLLADEYVESFTPGESEVNQTIRYLDPGVEPDREAIRAEMNHTPIVQEVVPSAPGTEYAFRALYDHGELIASNQKRQIRGKTYAGGTSVFRRMVYDPQLEAVGRRLLDRLDWHGLASVQFIENAETGEYTLMEINPRFGPHSPATSLRARISRTTTG
jgi:predicted ATP-grasp superfamily ATP-dependent carboligase